MIYYVVLLAIIILGLFSSVTTTGKTKKAITNALFVLVVIICILLIGGRSIKVGLDTKGYKESFDTITLKDVRAYWSNFDIRHTEIFYYTFIYLLKTIGLSFNFLLWFEAFVYIIPISIMIKRKSTNVFLSLLFFIGLDYFFFSLTGLRQTIALGLVTVAIIRLCDKKLLTPFLLILCATLFHTSAIVAFPIIVLRFIPFNKKTVLLFCGLALIVFLLKNKIVTFIQGFALHQASIYSTDTGGKGTYLLFVSILMLAIFFVFSNRVLSSKKFVLFKKKFNYGFFFNLIAIVVIIFPALQFNPTAFRIHYYYSISILIALPVLLNRVKSPTFKTALVSVYIAVTVFYMFTNPIQVMGVNPYAFY